MPTKPQTIFRIIHDPNNPYVIIDKRPLEKPYMSWRAKGLLSYLLSRPDDWVVRLGDLVKRSTDGSFATRQALRELVKAGHAKPVESRKDDGTYGGVVYEIYEQPHIENRQAATPHSDSPQADKPHAVKRALSNIDGTNKESPRDEDDGDVSMRIASLSKLYESNIGPITGITADFIRNAAIDFPESWYKPAFEIAVKNNARKWSYVEAILDGWQRNGFGWKPPAGNGRQSARNAEPKAFDPIRQFLGKDVENGE